MKRDGEGNGRAVRRPAAIVIELARLCCGFRVVHRAMPAQEQRLVPRRADVAGVGGEPHPQPQAAVGRAEAAEDVAHLLFCVQGRLIEADKAVAGPQVLPHIFVGLHVREANGRAGREAPRPFGRAGEDAAQRRIEPPCFVDDVGHLDKRGAKDDGAQVRIFVLLRRVHEHGLGFE